MATHDSARLRPGPMAAAMPATGCRESLYRGHPVPAGRSHVMAAFRILSRSRTGISMPTSPPDADALAHSAHLQALIRAQIAAARGAVPSPRSLELALYAPGLGSYTAGATKFGRAGASVTAHAMGPTVAPGISESSDSARRQTAPATR